MRFYHIKDEYVDFLRQYDSKVLYNKSENRPYVGIVLKLYDICYFAPLSSPKPKHIHMRNSLDFRKIDSGKLGAVNLNNMIPVPEYVLMPIHISEIQDKQYRRLLNEQYQWLLRDIENIKNAAQKLRQIFLLDDKQLSSFKKKIKTRCCDFLLLESKCKEFSELQIAAQRSQE